MKMTCHYAVINYSILSNRQNIANNWMDAISLDININARMALLATTISKPNNDIH